VLGGERDGVIAAIEKLGLTAANENGAGQIVAAGDLAALEQLAANAPEGSRVRALSVAGAFHTHYMSSAVERLAMLSRSVTVRDPRTRLLSNKDGAVVHHGREVLERIVGQISNPVRWDLCMETMVDLGVTAVIEVPPAGTLVGLIKRAMPGVETLALKTPEDIPAALDLVARHGTPSALDNQPTWRLVVAPLSGTFKHTGIELGAQLKPGAVVGVVENRRESVELIAEHGGTVIEFLAEENDPVAPGQPLVRLHPKGQH